MTLFDEGGESAARDTGDAPARCKLVVAYDGTDFHGFAAQPAVRTVEGELTESLAKVLRRAPVDLTCAGRTDAGVHAWGQVVSFAAPDDVEPDRVRAALNRMLAPEVVVRSVEVVDAAFDARRSAKWRTYTYAVVNRPVPDPFLARYSWWVPDEIDLPALRLGADPFVGEHDFAAFCRRGPEGSTTTRRVLASRWRVAEDGVLRYEITATAFCWQMVRSIVGTLVEVGTGRIRPGDLLRIIRSRDRAAAGRVAPPAGLCLWEVGYE
ncbi:MAG TPA: tRNA pseudouridine(38-40) synthase TruA [Acidimicrobiia bacterium]